MSEQRGDVAQDVLTHLMSNDVNRDKLLEKYQELFNDDPVSTIERLQKLIPKSARKDPSTDSPPVGIELVITGSGKKNPKKQRRAKAST